MGKLNFQDIKVDREEERVEVKAPKKASIFTTKIEPEAEVFAPKEEEHTSFVEAQYTEDRRAYQEPQVQHQPNYAQPRGYAQPQEAYGAPTPSYVQPKETYAPATYVQPTREAYTAPSVMQHHNPQGFYEGNGKLQKETSLAVLESENFVTVDIAGLNVQRVKLPEMKDVKGNMSRRIAEIENQTGISVLPFFLTQTMPTVVQLQEHKIIYIDGMPYSSGTTRIVNQREIDSIIEEVFETVSMGEVAVIKLLCDREVGGRAFRTLRVNDYEVQTLLGALADYMAYIKMNKDNEGEMVLIAGDFYNKFR